MTSSRFSRQEILGRIGKDGQEKLAKATVVIVGLGALGSVTAELACRAGVKHLIIVDHDVVEESNLPRQLLYAEQDIGTPKAAAAKKRLQAIWKEAEIDAHAEHLDAGTIKILDEADVILDGTDNFETRFLMNDYAMKKRKLFIYAGTIETRGLVFPAVPDGKSPDLHDVLGNAKSFETCGSVGIVSTASVLTATLQWSLALKWILGETIESALYHIDSWDIRIEKIKVRRQEKEEERKKEKRDEKYVMDLCLTKNMMRTRLLSTERLNMERLKRKFEVVKDNGIVAVFRIEGNLIIVHNYGEVLYGTLREERKIREIAEEIYRIGLS